MKWLWIASTLAIIGRQVAVAAPSEITTAVDAATNVSAPDVLATTGSSVNTTAGADHQTKPKPNSPANTAGWSRPFELLQEDHFVDLERCKGDHVTGCGCDEGRCWRYLLPPFHDFDPWCYTKDPDISDPSRTWAICTRNEQCSPRMFCGDELRFNADEVLEVPGFTVSSGSDDVATANASTAAECLLAIQKLGDNSSHGQIFISGPNAGACHVISNTSNIIIVSDKSATLLSARRIRGGATKLTAVQELAGDDLQEGGVRGVPNAGTCMKLCFFHPQCNAAMYHPRKKQCWLKHNSQPATPLKSMPCGASIGLCHPETTSYYF